MPRATVANPVAGGATIADTRERAAVRETFDRNALPEFLRFAKHLDNGGAGYEITNASTLKLAHGLGRPHKGCILTMNARSAGAPLISEVRSDHVSYDATVAKTHVQLISNSANAATVKVMVF